MKRRDIGKREKREKIKNSFYLLNILKMLDNLPRKKTEQDYTNGGIWCLVYLFLISGIVYFISSLF